MLNKYVSNQNGLTLVELLAAVVILGIVSTIAVVSIGNVIQNTREDAVRADAIQILNAAELYVASGLEVGSTIGLNRHNLSDMLTKEGAFEEYEWVIIRNSAGELTFSGFASVGSKFMVFNRATVDLINESRGELVIIGPL